MASSSDPPEDQRHDQWNILCKEVLAALLDALQDSPPDLDGRISLPQRLQVRKASSGPIRHGEEGECSAEVDVRVGETDRTYVLSVTLRRTEAFATLRDQEGFRERFDLSNPREPLREEDVQALYEALAVDIASHFGTDS